MDNNVNFNKKKILISIFSGIINIANNIIKFNRINLIEYFY